MHSNINNAPENNRTINDQPQFMANYHICLNTSQNACHNFAILVAFLILILSTVIIVMLMTLKYVGFGNLVKGDDELKVIFKKDHCNHDNFIERGNFLNIKIKTAFVIMCLQFILSFLLIILAYTCKKQTKKKLQSKQIINFALISSVYRALFLFISSCILLMIIVFGTYLEFFIAGNSLSISQNCRFTIINQQIVAIIVLSGILIVLLLLMLILFACLFRKHHCIDSPQCKAFSQKQKFPTQVDYRASLLNNGMIKYRETSQGQKRNSQNIFRPLKTQDFLLQSKFDQNRNLQVSNQHEQREDNTDPTINLKNKKNLQTELYKTKKDERYQQLNGNILIKENFHENEKYSFEQISVNNSLEKHKNSPMLNSVQMTPNQYELGILPFNSKKKPQMQEKLTKYQKQQKYQKSAKQQEHAQQQGYTNYLKQAKYTKSANNLSPKRQLVSGTISDNIYSSGLVKIVQISKNKSKNTNKNLTTKKVNEIFSGKNPSNEEAIKDQVNIEKKQQLQTKQTRKIKKISLKKHNSESYRQGRQESCRQHPQNLQKQTQNSLVQAKQLDKTIIQRLQQILVPINSRIQKQKIERLT